ncbi:MAG: hypothetical protein O7E52_14475 [Candidatus Poribacteria bacterium]|nr:hypothetical protein [Candidatus Poribacteria bacterium]
MERTVFWVWFGVILYWIYCIFWGVKGFRRTRTASDYFIAGRQLPLLIAGIVVIGISTIVAIGGWSAFTAKLKGLDPSLLEVPGIMKFKASGPEWTGIKTLTYMFALMGIQAAPAFSMWAFSNRDTRPFPWQQAVASSLIVGAVLIFFTAFQGLGGQIMFQAGDISLPEKAGGGLDTDALVPTLMGKTLPTPLLVFTAIAAIAAMQSTGAAYMSTGGGMLTRDLFVRYIKPDASNAAQIWFGRLSVIFITVLAFIVAFISGDQLVLLSGLAVSYGFQMYPALIGALFWRRLTRQGIVAGLIAGIIAVSATYMIQGFRYPLTIHSAGWGILSRC